MRNKAVLKTRTNIAMTNVADPAFIVRKCLVLFFFSFFPHNSTRHGCLHHNSSRTQLLQADSAKSDAYYQRLFITER
jgi:hypothetical protein